MKNSFCIFGATSGIGLDFVKKNLKKNKIYCIGQNFTELEKFAIKNKCKKNFIKIKTDLRKISSFNIYKKIKNKLDFILIASGSHALNIVKYLDNNLYDDILNINLNNPVKIISKLYSLNKINKGANIIFIGSINGSKIHIPGSLAYGVSKSGLKSACKFFAVEMSNDDIKVNLISPGMVKTPLIKKATHLSSEGIKKDKKKYILGKDYLSTKVILKTINFLISKEQTNITGEEIIIDSGYTLNK
jgi:NAD(P)-dependent dehydrogenase (short-subunit alcohol dehydrogenase family)